MQRTGTHGRLPTEDDGEERSDRCKIRHSCGEDKLFLLFHDTHQLVSDRPTVQGYTTSNADQLLCNSLVNITSSSVYSGPRS